MVDCCVNQMAIDHADLARCIILIAPWKLDVQGISQLRDWVGNAWSDQSGLVTGTNTLVEKALYK